MRKIESVKTITYELNSGYMVDIVILEDKQWYEVWLYGKTMSVKSLLFGESMKNKTIEDIIYIVENGNTDGDIQNYEEMYGNE